MAQASIQLEGSSTDEAEEVRLAKARDQLIWSALYDNHYDTVYRYAYARLRNREEAEDVAAQVFLNALRGIDSYRYKGKPLLAWFYRIARNLVVDHLRKKVSRGFDEGLGVGAAADPGSDSLELAQALSRLNPLQREVIVLHFIVGMSLREVAAMLEKSDSAVYSLHSRALTRLRLHLSG